MAGSLAGVRLTLVAFGLNIFSSRRAPVQREKGCRAKKSLELNDLQHLPGYFQDVKTRRNWMKMSSFAIPSQSVVFLRQVFRRIR